MDDQRTKPAHPGEPRLPATLGVVVAIGLYAVLPSALRIGPRFVIPGLELLLFIPLVLANPRRMSKENRFLRRLSIGLVFALAYWELDRGGPVTRFRVGRPGLPAADFRFPQDEDHDAISEVAQRSSAKSGWAPGFIDYLYVSVTNSSAFSPTDTMPLTVRAKLLMAVESVSALVLSILVVAFAVGLLGR
jgi:hypothetical protein